MAFLMTLNQKTAEYIQMLILCEAKRPGTVAVPLNEISLYRVCKVVDPDAMDKMIGIHTKPSPFCPVGKNIKPVLGQAYDKVKQDMMESMSKITLDTMVADFHERIQ